MRDSIYGRPHTPPKHGAQHARSVIRGLLQHSRYPSPQRVRHFEADRLFPDTVPQKRRKDDSDVYALGRWVEKSNRPLTANDVARYQYKRRPQKADRDVAVGESSIKNQIEGGVRDINQVKMDDSARGQCEVNVQPTVTTGCGQRRESEKMEIDSQQPSFVVDIDEEPRRVPDLVKNWKDVRETDPVEDATDEKATINRSDGKAENSTTKQRTTDVKHDVRDVTTNRHRVALQKDKLYRLLHKNADDLHKSVTANIDLMLDELQNELSSLFEKRMDECRASIDQVLERNMCRIERAVKETDKEPDVHRFVIVTKKSVPDTFHMTTAFDRKDANKKINRCRDRDRLLLEFNAHSEFNVSQLKNILEAEKMLVKSKSTNDFKYEGGILKDLRVFLDKLIRRSSTHTIRRDDYRLVYIAADDNRTQGKVPKESADAKEEYKMRRDVRRTPTPTDGLGDLSDEVGLVQDDDEREEDVSNWFDDEGDDTDGGEEKTEKTLDTPDVRSHECGRKRKRSLVDSLPGRHDAKKYR